MVPVGVRRAGRAAVTANGKLDRRALPAPDAQRPELAQAYRAPANDAERTLAPSSPRCSASTASARNDNFFELGGNSLLALRA